MSAGTLLRSRVVVWGCLLLVAGGMCACAAGQAAGGLLLPSAVAADAQGNVYVAETGRHEVVRVDAVSGAVTVVAGTGVQGFAGDGGPAVAAELDSPAGVAVSGGVLYVSDTRNERVRMVDAAGVMTTVAGTGVRGFAGDGGAAVNAEMDGPGALAVDDAGAVYVADVGNHRVRRIAAGGISTVAGDGVQGFGGDGGAAVAAELDSPGGLAWAGGVLYIADTHNQRVRAVQGGVIATVAGTGAVGFGGDGGAAVRAALALPRGVTVDAAGNVVIADSGNERVRVVSAGGVMGTLAGSGVQGVAANGTEASAAEMSGPGGVAAVPGAVVVADTGNGAVREIVEGKVVGVGSGGGGGPVTPAVVLTVPSETVYGSGMAAVTVSGGGAAPTGTVVLMDGRVQVASAGVTAGQAEFGLAGLGAGSHVLTAQYGGDVGHLAGVSNGVAVSVSPLGVTATANAMQVSYGAVIPAAAGTVSGVLPGDVGRVQVSFVAQVMVGAGPGSYPIVATVSGAAAGDYAVTMAAGSGELTIVPAGTVTTMSVAGSAYAGQSVTLTAQVSGGGAGVPAGMVNFLDGGTVLGSAALAGGSASLQTTGLGVGSHVVTAVYAGNGDFAGSSSAAVGESVLAVPDFVLALTGPGTAAVSKGSSATYLFTVGPQSGAFAQVVEFAATGLPAGAIASFTPVQVIPGSAATAVTLTVQLPATTGAVRGRVPAWAAMVLLLPLLRVRRRGRLLMLLVMAGWLGTVGCGDRTVTISDGSSSTYAVTVTASAVSAANTLLQHAVQVSLSVE